MSANGIKTQGIFISYRRTDTRADAGRLHDRLATRFGEGHVFMDIDDIEPGQNFQKVLQDTLDTCHVLLVLIGPGWLDATDTAGSLRLRDEQDFVRQEVQTALQRGIQLIPILFDRAVMPARDDLPPGMESLAERQALEISDRRFHEDVNELIKALERILPDQGKQKYSRRYVIVAFGALALILVLASSWFLWQERVQESVLILRKEPALVSRAEMLDMLVDKNLFDSARYQEGTGPGNRYEMIIIDGDAVVIDHSTRLMWQQAVSGRQYPLAQARTVIRELNNQAFAGYADWRLPTMEEAMSLLTPKEQDGTHMSPLLSPQDTPVMWTADQADEKYVWVVYANGGTAARERPVFNAWARAVRSMR